MVISVKLDWFVVNCFLDDCAVEKNNCSEEELKLIEQAEFEFSVIAEDGKFHLSEEVLQYFMDTLSSISGDYYMNKML